MKNKIDNEKGLTLLEVLLSITLLSIVMITFLSFFTNAFRFNSMNDDSIQAMNIAREWQALIKKKSWDDIKTDYILVRDDPNDPDDFAYYIKTFNHPENAEYVIEISIKVQAETGNFYQELRPVHVQVTKDGKKTF